MKVLKFGGASLKDKNAYTETIRILAADKEPKVLVLSAIYGMTDWLETTIREARTNEQSIEDTTTKIRAWHAKILTDLVSDPTMIADCMNELEERVQKLERLLYGLAYTEEMTPQLYALIMSFGERLSVILSATIFKAHGIPAQYLESDRIGIVTDDSFTSATALLPIVRKNLPLHINPLLEKGITPLITGFFGVNKNGKVTLFGRNSSDYSAAVVAHGLKADRLEIWKDVDGFMTADPKIVPTASLIDKLSYYEAAELSYFGAKILHPRSVEPLLHDSIPLVIRNIYHPEIEGTEICAQEIIKNAIIKSVTYNKNISVLRIRGAGVGYKPGVISEIGSRLAACGVNIYSIITSQTCINLLIDRKDSQTGYQALQVLKDGLIDSIEHCDDEVVVAAVGAGLKQTPGLAAKIFSAIAGQEINIEMISLGASDVATYFLVKEPYLVPAVNALHTAFFTNSNN
ncbi:MAG TPA: aspartate kinase [Candidatus Marinimicrobia bacterium]|nr:aspartate kinase [Candidatus Neomarinimicrobiota bacterium]